MAERAFEIDVLDDQNAARPKRLEHVLQHDAPIGEMRQDEAAIHEVVGARLRPLADVLATEFEVVEPEPRALRLRRGPLHCVDFEANDAALRADPAREFEADVATAAADVHTAHAGADARFVEQRVGRRRHGPREQVQAEPARLAAA